MPYSSLASEIVDKLKQSPVVTLLADESTDLSNKKRLVIYTQIISDEMIPSTHNLYNVECTDTTGKGIAGIIQEEASKRGIQPQNIMSFGSDGASVMTGKVNGTAAILRRQNPHMTNIHCIAHRLAPCSSQASDSIPHLKEHQQVLTDLFYYFKGSSKCEARLRAILDDPLLSIKEIQSVRWLSYFNALTAVYRTLDSLPTFLAEACSDYKDAKAVGLLKKIGTTTFLSVTHMMLDAMMPVTQLSQFFQTVNVDVALVKVKIDLCLSDLHNVTNLDTPYQNQLKKDLTGTTYKGHHITVTSNFDLQKLTNTFVDALSENINKRFPEDGLLFAFSVLGMRPISLLSREERDNYGNEAGFSLEFIFGGSLVKS